MKTIASAKENLIEIKKSKFISYSFPVYTDQEVQDILTRLNKEHKTATHVTYAYVLSSPAVERCSDDGEPSGTAGKPILDMIKKNDFNNILIVVVRYFGGVKLGAGGLCRAYSASAKSVLDISEPKVMRICNVIKIVVGIDNKYIIDSNSQINVLKCDYLNIANKVVNMDIIVPKDDELMSLLRGIAIKLDIIDEKLM